MDGDLLAFSIIAEAGEAKSFAMESAHAALERDFEKAGSLMEQCEKTLASAHEIQTGMIRDEMSGKKQEIGLLMVHAQDHLAGAGLIHDMSGIIVQMCEQISRLESANKKSSPKTKKLSQICESKEGNRNKPEEKTFFADLYADI